MNAVVVLWRLLHAGHMVSDPKLWKERGNKLQVALIAIMLAASGVANAFGYTITLPTEVAAVIASGIIAAIGVFFSVITTDKIGLPAKELPPEPVPEPEADLFTRTGVQDAP